ncbi:NAD(P)/FAD-dependent oxidoreductase [Mycobacterium intracellulare]|uniref:NAD(P)/FAD-dependent oxidoreductase n=1 Tax=Mycobacterium intracellulare TaxID=1767 RepID=UPI001CDA18C2|nr:FAD/NAD(P)-binding oxidoreductase [Mycobacterium intracellulare]MCA2306060.1 NAD(P)/FAD-dependent oxidoreductase [Mycobacterium intracellulare]MCA2348287.1 NAD(P)/FAD-dependent oxidoreductase [Mycobacterium intracellulare]
MHTNKKLVILGAGIGGLSVVKELTESGVPLDDLDIIVVDEDFSHYVGFTLPWVMRGWRDQDSVPIRPSADTLSGLTTVTGSVASIDPVARTVTLADSTDIAFDALVIATGARNAVDKVPGLAAAVKGGTAVHYYSADAAADAHRALRNFTGGKLVFLVTSQPFRCPPAPYEGALLAADLLSENGCRDATQLSVYSPETQPMLSAGPYAGQELVALLAENNIDFYGEHSVAHVDADTRVIEFQDGAVAGFDLLVFIPPHEPAIELDGAGWIGVDATTMATQHPGIFAIGDTTAITSPSGRPLPKAAIFAKNGAKAAAQSALHYLEMTDHPGTLSGEGYCYIDTGAHTSAQGKGDFFTLPQPAIHLTAPSVELHHDKHQEEHDWRALWEHPTSATR